MAGFNDFLPIEDMITEIKTELVTAIKDVGTAFRGLYRGIVDDLKSLPQKIATTISELPAKIAEQIKQIPQDLMDNIMLGPGFSLTDFINQVRNPSWDALTNVLEKITGINIQRMAMRFVTGITSQLRIGEYMEVLKRQIAMEVKECLEGYLRSLINKFPFLGILLDLSGWISRMIGRYRLDFQLHIEDEIDKLLYDKIKIQQIGLFKQEVLRAVRKICPLKGGSVSGSLTRKMQTDTSWRIVDGVHTLQELADLHGGAEGAQITVKNSSGASVQAATEEAAEAIAAMAEMQAISYGIYSMSDYIAPDGTVGSQGAWSIDADGTVSGGDWVILPDGLKAWIPGYEDVGVEIVRGFGGERDQGTFKGATVNPYNPYEEYTS